MKKALKEKNINIDILKTKIIMIGQEEETVNIEIESNK